MSEDLKRLKELVVLEATTTRKWHENEPSSLSDVRAEMAEILYRMADGANDGRGPKKDDDLERMKELSAIEAAATRERYDNVPSDLRDVRRELTEILNRMESGGDVGVLLEAERAFLETQLKVFGGDAHTEVMRSWLTKAITELDAALRSLDSVRDPNGHQAHASVMTLTAARRGGLPPDDATVFFKNHITELGDQIASIGQKSKCYMDLLGARKSAMVSAEQGYCRLQEAELGTKKD